MLQLSFGLEHLSSPWVLCLGAHSDDIEIGCGGTILRLIEEYPKLCFYWVVLSAESARADEALASAGGFLRGAAKSKIIVKSFRDGYFPYFGAEIKDYFEELKQVNPVLILTHFRDDLHQDHRLVSELSWNTFRNHLILEYEVPKYDGGLGSPNVFVPLARVTAERKCDLLEAHFQTQSNKHWFTRRTFLSVLTLRGIESRAPEQLAEAFYARKQVFLPGLPRDSEKRQAVSKPSWNDVKDGK